jgi:hypothetical protein
MREGTNVGRRTRPAVIGGIALSAVMLSQVALVSPAMAVTGLTRTVGTSASNSVAKSANAPCATGTTVIGGGGFVTGAAGQVGMDIMLPLWDGTGFSVTGREDETGTSANWSVTSTALCAPAPSGFQVMSGSTGFASNATDWVTVSCPLGTVALGVGGAVNGASNSEVVLEQLRIDTSSVTVGGAEDGTGYAGNWQVQGRAMCANQPAGYERLLTDSAYDSVSPKSLTLSCSPGKKVHGVGAEILGGDGQVRLTGAYASSSTAVTVSATEDEDGYSSTWKVRAFAICAT